MSLLGSINNNAKRVARTGMKIGVFVFMMWVTTDDEKESVRMRLSPQKPDVDNNDERERDAAYLTMGLITAARNINTAHENGEDCRPHHEAMVTMLTQITDQLTGIRVIQHLTDITASSVDDEDLAAMVSSVMSTELEEDDDDLPPLD